MLVNICRTCMNSDENVKEAEVGKRKTISIFNEAENMESRNITIMDLLMITTPQLRIDSDDMLPKVLCESCLKKLLNVYEFQKMCISVEQKLREIIKESHRNLDPLKNLSMDGILENVNDDLHHIVKIEMDELLINQNGSSVSNSSIIEDVELMKFGSEHNRWEDVTDSEDSNEGNNSEWEKMCSDEKSKNFPNKTNDNLIKIEKQSSEIPKEFESNSMNEGSIKNNESKNFECDECGNRLSTRKSLKRHKGIHLRTVGLDKLHELDESKDSAIKKFECDECGNRLSTLKSLKRHKRLHLRRVELGQKNKSVKTKYECEFCQKVFQQSSSLKDHLRKHTGEQPYLCSECGKAFKSLSNMKQHFLRHGTARPYMCPDCPKKFPCLSDLSSHKAVHNKIKSHVCDICGAAFVKPYLLKKHNMYHTGEKNHKCDYCDMRFVVADHCRRHMRTHTGEKPYKCKYCERAFAQSNDLTKHLRGHLGDNVYKCDLCPQGFRLQGDLRAHFYTHKNDDEETRSRNLQALKDEERRLQIKFGLIKCT